ncbi:NUDIX hydrolase [Nocardioides marmoriginsengisoli]|uniref:NUDIX hydrolase n=1 Tax=Nocardioides marmoriginsengisoli TaxID=661483 RepID=A0A3N0CSA3_9ACTN|nr:NUDIX hydrolase [Nocardioides marmoriginsengisoli]
MLANGPDVVAAGAVVVRKDGGGEVLLVHRPKYDDWAWPKGKRDPGEHVTTTAVREVLEETGVEIRLDRPLPPQLYVVSGGRAKTVHYWIGRVVGDPDVSGYAANDEIDQVAWFGFDKARARLTYTGDVELLDRVERRHKRTSVLVVLRHARATKRATWTGPDEERPLTNVGRVQARSLIPVLSAFGVTRVVTSDSQRCLRTVTPYARDQVLAVEAVPGLNEVDSTAVTVETVVRDLLATKENAVLCTHRPVLPDVLDVLGISEEPLGPGEMVVCHHRKGRVVATERYLVR